MINVAVGLIVRNRTEILLCQRKPHLPYPLKWEFPGGKMMHGENAEECLRRELAEELHITAEIGGLYHRGQYIYPDSGTFDVSYFLVSSFSGSIVNNVFEQLRWVQIGHLPSYNILEGNADVMRMLMSEYGAA
jgi:8-oxo-dGTP diphosphatase